MAGCSRSAACWPASPARSPRPVRSLTPGMGFSVLIESFIVTVIGGMGSILGALIGALLIGLIRSFGSLGFPLFTEGLMYLFMVIVLVAAADRPVRQGSGMTELQAERERRP